LHTVMAYIVANRMLSRLSMVSSRNGTANSHILSV
jgi:hypothetical protein